jgi:SAM-dependent methyltransferase
MWSRTRTAIIASLTVIVSLVAKSDIQTYFDNATTRVQVGIILVGAVLFTLALLGADWAISQPYQRSAHLRYWWDRLFFKPYLEGYWVDVGIDKSSGRFMNYSFITIVHTGTDYRITGRTWNVSNTPEYNWESIWLVSQKGVLDFWYQATRESSNAPKTAKSKFTFTEGVLLPNEYVGEYAEVYETNAERVSSINFFQNWWKELPEAQRRKAAHDHLQKLMKDRNYDPATFMPRRSQQTDLREAYFAFLEYSDKARGEKTLVDNVFGNPAHRAGITSILDLGPGEGFLTSCVLDWLTGPKPTYTAVDVSGALLDDLEPKLKESKLAHIDLRRGQIETFLAVQPDHACDLILAFNSLYYVTGIDEVCNHMLRVLRPGGRIAALHTNISQLAFLDNLLAQVSSSVNRDVKKSFEKLAKDGGLSLLEWDGAVTIEFPTLDDVQWSLVAHRAFHAGTPDANDTANLISFLLNVRSETLDESVWKDAVATVQEHVETADGELRLPIKLQLLQKAA